MAEYKCLITAASWEDRCRLGFERIMRMHSVKSVLVLYYHEYSDWTRENRTHIESRCRSVGVAHSTKELFFSDHVLAWKTVGDAIEEQPGERGAVLVDISTMPRDLIWTAFHFLQLRNDVVHYLYHRPVKYGSERLSFDPGKPRLLFKHSGVAVPDKKTALFIQTGFDPDRVRQLLNFFEPQAVFLGMQSGNQYRNDELNRKEHEKFLDRPSVTPVVIDAYAPDNGFSILDAQLSPVAREYNLVLCSLGPKPLAAALYRFNIANPHAALAYVPMGKYSKEYSYGIDEDHMLTGVLDLATSDASAYPGYNGEPLQQERGE